MIKLFLRAFISDYLYDRYQAKMGSLNMFRDVIFHYFILWGGGFLAMHIFLGFLLYEVWVTDIDIAFYQRTIAFGVIVAMFFLIWIFAGKLYGTSPDRPVENGINDESMLPKWLR